MTESRRSRRKISNSCSNSLLMKYIMTTRAMMAMNAANTPWKAACTRNGARMNDLVAPTSFIVWIVNLRA